MANTGFYHGTGVGASPGLQLLFSLFHTLISSHVPTCCMKSHRFIILITLLSVLTHAVESFHSIRSALWGGGCRVGGVVWTVQISSIGTSELLGEVERHREVKLGLSSFVVAVGQCC